MRCLFYLSLIALSIASTPSYAVETGTSTIKYYFGLNVSQGGSSGPVTPENCTNSCSGSTPDQRAYPDCSCYCAEQSCSNGYVFDISSCSCVISCSEGVDNDGNCCPAPGYDAANCITKETNANGCEVYVSACESPRVCDGAGACVCPDATPIWTGSDCVECVLNTDCPSEKPLCENNMCVNKCDGISLTVCQTCNPLTGVVANLTGVSCAGGICQNGTCVIGDGSCDPGYKWDSSLAQCVCDGANTQECCLESGGAWVNGMCQTYCYEEEQICAQTGRYADVNDNCACKCPNGTEFDGEKCVSPCEAGGVYCETGWCCDGICCPEGTMYCDAAFGICCEGPVADKSSGS